MSRKYGVKLKVCNLLIILQNRAIKIFNFRDSASPLYKASKIFKLSDNIRLQNFSFVDGDLHGNVPPALDCYQPVDLQIGNKIPVCNLYIKKWIRISMGSFNVLKEDCNGYNIHFVLLLQSFVGMANSYDCADLQKLQKKYWQLHFCDIAKENWTRCLYLIISFKRLNEIT